MSPTVEMVDSPDNYNPSFCEAVRAGCAAKIENVENKVEKLDNRIFTLLLLGIGNLVTALGGLFGVLLFK